MWPFRSAESLAQEGKALRSDALKYLAFGNYDAAYQNYKRAYPIYVKLGDQDSQCAVLCSLAETTPRDAEVRGYVEAIDAICRTISNSDARARAVRNLDALKQRLKDAHRWP